MLAPFLSFLFELSKPRVWAEMNTMTGGNLLDAPIRPEPVKANKWIRLHQPLDGQPVTTIHQLRIIPADLLYYRLPDVPSFGILKIGGIPLDINEEDGGSFPCFP